MKRLVINNIKEYNLIKPGDTVVAGVSGGHDSMALLYVLKDLQADYNFNLVVAHVNHGVRGLEARRDEKFVRQVSGELGLEYYFTNVDMEGYAKKKGISDEEAGRLLRYGFFREILAKYDNKGSIAVAHNKNDQAETLIMRSIRGTGLDGLRGMDYKNDDIIRPILNIDRYNIEEYIEKNSIPVVLDYTNKETVYTRNKIRLELIPFIEENFNPNFIEAMWRLSDMAKLDIGFIDKYTNQVYNRVVSFQSIDQIKASIDDLIREDRAIVQRVIRKMIEAVEGNLQGFSEGHILDILELVNIGETGKQIDLPNNILCIIDYNNLIIKKNNEVELKDYYYLLKLGENLVEGLDCKINVTEDIIENKEAYKLSKNLSIFDLDKISGNLAIRNRRSGDKFSPLGMKGSKKVKDFFIDNKVSKIYRDKVPFIVENDNIMWIVGYRMSEKYKVDESTRNILIIEFIDKI